MDLPALLPGQLRVAAAAAHFGRDLEQCLGRVELVIDRARQAGAGLVVLPEGALGGYLEDLDPGAKPPAPPAVDPHGPELERVRRAAREVVVCLGYTQAPDAAGGLPWNAAVCLTGDGVLGRHRKVHQPPAEAAVYAAGDAFTAFDTPVGRIGMLVDYDKTFPEAARTLALDGARLLAVLSAWPASRTGRAPRLVQDRQSRLFDLYDCARAAENQVVLASSNQTGSLGRLRFLGQAKVVGPAGDVRARTWAKAGLAVAAVDLDAEVGQARRELHHLAERRPEAYA